MILKFTDICVVVSLLPVIADILENEDALWIHHTQICVAKYEEEEEEWDDQKTNIKVSSFFVLFLWEGNEIKSNQTNFAWADSLIIAWILY